MLLASACHKDNGPCLTCPPPYIQSIILDSPSAELTTVEFQMHTTDSTHLGIVQLYRDSVSVFSKMILSIDTTITDTALLPSHRYRYKAYRLTGPTRTDSSAPLSISTMDTTSQNFTWEIDTLGDGNSSVLNDVAIINDTLIYAVGEMYKRDSTGQFEIDPYNVAIWTGSRWRLQRLYYQNGTGPIRSVFAISETNVWLDPWFHWDGQNFQQVPIDQIFSGARINKMWGALSSLYAVGDNGFIAHYDGRTWQKLESGTTRGINDVWGIEKPLNNNEDLYCAITAVADPQNSWIMKITNASQIDSVQWGAGREIVSLWTYNGSPLYVCGGWYV